ncbi:methyltransferase domain-containing protein [Bacillus sp. 1A]|uniref:methyltransferase domain-containing protein n=1 Tax=Bacillus sp. 1A TaxID=3461399 RepID=UPI004044FB06
MIIASINLNKRLQNNNIRIKIEEWLYQNNIDVAVFQEPYKHIDQDPPELAGYHNVGGNHNVCCYIKDIYELPNQRLITDYFQYIKINNLHYLNVYLNSYKTKERALQLEMIRSFLEDFNYNPLIISGDFNIAPRPCDGLYGENISRFNSHIDRTPLQLIIEKLNLIEVQNTNKQQEFTYEKKVKDKWIKFRCDLALISKEISKNTFLKYDHTVRTNNKFTDHSALIINNPFELNSIQVNSHKTAMSRTGPSKIAKYIVGKYQKELLRSSLLDFGCGRGTDVDFYRNSGIDADGYDPHLSYGWSKLPSRMYDLIVINYVLNVLESRSKRIAVLREASKYLSPKGKMIIVTRSSNEINREALRKNWQPINDGYWSHKKKGTFQKGIDDEELLSLGESINLEKCPTNINFNFKPNSSYIILQNKLKSNKPF